MAHHKDIDRASARLEGAQGWHIINTTRPHTTNKKDKRSCIYYNKNKTCSYLKCYCMGSSDCSAYTRKA